MVEQQPSKLMTRVRFPSPAPLFSVAWPPFCRQATLVHTLNHYIEPIIDDRAAIAPAIKRAASGHAGVGATEVVFLDEADPHGGPLGSKGTGELGICGAGAAVINAIHNATGARIRNFPATPDKLLATRETLDGGEQSIAGKRSASLYA